MDRRKAADALLQPADLAFGAALKLAGRGGENGEQPSSAYRVAAKILRHQLEMLNELEVSGEHNVPEAGGVILAANHQSILDYAVMAASAPREAHLACASDHCDTPLLRHIISMSSPVSGGGCCEDDLQSTARVLGMGGAVAMFPEGAIPGGDLPRSCIDPQTGLLNGNSGLIRLAVRSGVPIIPVGISGTGKAFPPEIYPRLDLLRLPARAPIRVRFGRPMILSFYKEENLTEELLRELTGELMGGISGLVDHRNNYIPIQVPAPAPKRHKSLGVLLLHGFTSSTDTVDGLIPHLEKAGIPYERPILRGHGTRYQDLRGVTARDWYNDAERALLALSERVEKVIVVGLSMGGLVATDLASRHPDKLAGLVTVAAALKFKDPLAGLSPLMARAVRYWPSPPSFHDPELAAGCTNYPKFPTDAFVSLYRYSKEVEARLPSVHVPALILAARRDQTICPDAALTIHERISSTIRELVWFERSGHEMMQDMEAEAVFERIMDFIERFRDKENARAA